MQCISCGKEMAASTAYCEFCGAPQQAQPQAEPQAEAAQEQAQNYNSYYTENQFNSYGSSSAQNYAYTAPMGGYDPYAPNENDKPMTVGGWVKTFIIMAIPLVNIIMMFVWAFGDGNTSRKNYFRAYLLLAAIMIGLSLLLVLFFGIGAGMSGGSSMVTQGV